MRTPPLKLTRRSAAEEDGVVLGRQLGVLEQDALLTALALDVRILLLRQTHERVLLSDALRSSTDLGSGAWLRTGGEALEAESAKSKISCISATTSATATITSPADTELDPTTPEGVPEADVEVAAAGVADAGTAGPADGVGLGFHSSRTFPVRVESLHGAGSATATKPAATEPRKHVASGDNKLASRTALQQALALEELTRLYTFALVESASPCVR